MRLGGIALAVCLAAAGCGGKKKGESTTANKDKGQSGKTGGASDAVGMNDGDPIGDLDPDHPDKLPGGGGGDDGGGGDGEGGDGGDGGGDDGTGPVAEPEAPPIVPPNLDISPDKARTEVEKHLRLARGFLAQSPPDPDGAIREAQATLLVDGTNIDAIVAIAHANYHKRLYDTAEVILDGLLQKRSSARNNPYLYYVYGLVYDQIGEAPKAFAAYKKAVSLDAGYTSALINLGVHQLRNKQYGDAVRTYEQLTGSLGRNDAATWNSLGSGYRGLSADYDPGNPTRDQWLGKAETAYKRALTIDKNYGPAYYNLGLLYLDADPFPSAGGSLDTLVRLNRAKTYFEEYKDMRGVDMKLFDERMKDVTKLIKREEKKRARAKREASQ